MRINAHDRKIPALILIMISVLSLVFTVSAEETHNLLVNGSFEEQGEDGLPFGWYTDAYITDEGYTVFRSEQNADSPDGGNAVFIRNIGENDARFAQLVEVEPESLYCFSGWIKAEDVKGGHGANLSIEGLYAFSESVYETGGEWRYVEWYGETGENTEFVTLYARLGGYSGTSTGKAWFDGLSLTKVNRIPGDGIADRWYTENTISTYDEEEDEAAGNPAWPLLMLSAFAYTVFALLLTSRINGTRTLNQNTGVPLFPILLSVAFLFRLIVSYYCPGYSVDVNCFVSWGNTMASGGPVNFYAGTGFCDYPPAYTYVLGLNSLVSGLISNGNVGITRIVFRLIPCACDILSCYLIGLFARKRQSGISINNIRCFCLILAFHPALVLNSAGWGQMDSVLCFCLLLVAVLSLDGKWEVALPVYMLSVLIKPQALMLGFLGLTVMILSWIKEPECRKKMLTGLGISAAVAVMIVLPFGIRQPFGWLITLYQKTLASYPYATVNTANLYYLCDGNWSSIERAATISAPLIAAILSVGFGTMWYSRLRKEYAFNWIEPLISLLFAGWFIWCAASGASWILVGTAAMAFAFFIVLSLLIRSRRISFLPYLGGLLFILLYVFGIKMHERYVFPALFLLGLAWAVRPDKRIAAILAIVGATTFLNEGIVLDNCIRLGATMGHLNSDTSVLAQIISVINVLTAVYAVCLGVEYCSGNTQKETGRFLFAETKRDARLHWNRKDTLILSAVLILYSIISFSTLGSNKAPQTVWTSSCYDENVTIDLGERHDAFSMLYFSRVSRYDFSVAVSDDGTNWSDEIWAEMNEGECWKWKYVTEAFDNGDGTRTYQSGQRHLFGGRYIRITAHQIGLNLCEVLFRDTDGGFIPATVCGHEYLDEESIRVSDPKALLDEQDTFEGLPVYFGLSGVYEGEKDPHAAQPCWWNGTYFDEIYHARTAFEFLNGTRPYETSHPPLGKIIMGWGVAVFGMTPFGWRFTGALAGVAILAGMYLLGKQLTKSTAIAALICALMALDGMHLTQTQIATIDSYPVLFIIFAFFFMLRFLQTDLRKENLRSILVDLGFSGLFMGLAIASKWIGIYAGAGLAVLYFSHCIRYLLKQRHKEANKTVMTISAWCVLFFVVVPAGIYLLSYIPYFAYDHSIHNIGDFVNAVIRTQNSMLSYHSTPGLGMNHPFYSPWYEWPVNGKPMYYASKQYVYNSELGYSIFCFGNPVVWLTAIGTMMLCFIAWIRRHTHPSYGMNAEVNGTETTLMFVLVGLLAQYLPWILVPRGTYIYHYFASVPFLICSIGLVIHQVRIRYRKTGTIILCVWCALATVAFCLLFPYMSGIQAPVGWLDVGKKLLKIWY